MWYEVEIIEGQIPMKRNRQTGCVRDQSLFSPKEGEVFRGDGGGCIRYPQSVRGGEPGKLITN